MKISRAAIAVARRAGSGKKTPSREESGSVLRPQPPALATDRRGRNASTAVNRARPERRFFCALPPRPHPAFFRSDRNWKNLPRRERSDKPFNPCSTSAPYPYRGPNCGKSLPLPDRHRYLFWQGLDIECPTPSKPYAIAAARPLVFLAVHPPAADDEARSEHGPQFEAVGQAARLPGRHDRCGEGADSRVSVDSSFLRAAHGQQRR